MQVYAEICYMYVCIIMYKTMCSDMHYLLMYAIGNICKIMHLN